MHLKVSEALRNLAGIRSCPQALAGFNFSNNFSTPSSVTLIFSMDGNGTPSGVGMSVSSSLVHVDSYWWFSMSTCSRPIYLRGEMPLLSLQSDFVKLKNLFCYG